MTGVLHSDVFDFGLEEIVERTDLICLVVNAPTQYALTTAGSANLIGFKAFDPGDAFDAPASDEVGRYVASANIVDGTTVSTGTAQFVGVVDTLRGRVLAYTNLASAARGDDAGNTWVMPPFKIRVPNVSQ